MPGPFSIRLFVFFASFIFDRGYLIGVFRPDLAQALTDSLQYTCPHYTVVRLENLEKVGSLILCAASTSWSVLSMCCYAHARLHVWSIIEIMRRADGRHGLTPFPSRIPSNLIIVGRTCIQGPSFDNNIIPHSTTFEALSNALPVSSCDPYLVSSWQFFWFASGHEQNLQGRFLGASQCVLHLSRVSWGVKRVSMTHSARWRWISWLLSPAHQVIQDICLEGRLELIRACCRDGCPCQFACAINWPLSV